MEQSEASGDALCGTGGFLFGPGGSAFCRHVSVKDYENSFCLMLPCVAIMQGNLFIGRAVGMERITDGRVHSHN